MKPAEVYTPPFDTTKLEPFTYKFDKPLAGTRVVNKYGTLGTCVGYVPSNDFRGDAVAIRYDHTDELCLYTILTLERTKHVFLCPPSPTPSSNEKLSAM